MRNLVEKRFSYELVGGVTNATQRRRTYSGVAIDQAAILVCDIIRSQLDAEHQNGVFLTTELVTYRIHVRDHAVACEALVPGDDLSGGIETGPQIMRRDRTQATVVHVVFTRPHHFDRTFRGL